MCFLLVFFDIFSCCIFVSPFVLSLHLFPRRFYRLIGAWQDGKYCCCFYVLSLFFMCCVAFLLVLTICLLALENRNTPRYQTALGTAARQENVLQQQHYERKMETASWQENEQQEQHDKREWTATWQETKIKFHNFFALARK